MIGHRLRDFTCVHCRFPFVVRDKYPQGGGGFEPPPDRQASRRPDNPVILTLCSVANSTRALSLPSSTRSWRSDHCGIAERLNGDTHTRVPPCGHLTVFPLLSRAAKRSLAHQQAAAFRLGLRLSVSSAETYRVRK